MKTKKKSLLILSLLLNFAFSQAQNATDHTNIFSLQHNRVGVPQGDSVYIYALQQGSWSVMDTVDVTRDYIGLDGNIRRIYVLMQDRIAFLGFHGEQNDTLRFSDTIPAPTARHWIRTPYSTEKDIWVYEGERQVTYVNEGGEWYTIDMGGRISAIFGEKEDRPLFVQDELAKVEKLYAFTNNAGEHIAAVYGDRVIFRRYAIPEEYRLAMELDFQERFGQTLPSQEEMTFSLTDDAITAFIYDQRMIAVVYTGHIRFYHYNFEKKEWLENPQVPDLALER